MASRKGKMRLGAFFNPTGHHVASWRHPDAQADAGVNFRHYVELAQTAERAKFDMVFLADNLCMRKAHIEATSRSAQYIANMEPITLLSALSAVTTRIGLVGTASTSYNEPFHVARASDATAAGPLPAAVLLKLRDQVRVYDLGESQRKDTTVKRRPNFRLASETEALAAPAAVKAGCSGASAEFT